MSLIVPKDTRIEIKFVGPELTLPHVSAWLKALPFMFRKTYPDRWVNSVYFDTHDLTAYEENLSGTSSRTKVRYRWYGKILAPDSGTLEIKKKRNNFGWKEKYAVNCSPYIEGATWRKIRALIINQIPSEKKHWLLENPQPVMINRYFRRYYESADHKIRATFDTGQAVWDQRYHPKPNFKRHAISLPKMMVLELKFDRNSRDIVSKILNTCPIRTSRNSKYVNAIRCIYQY